MVMMIRKLPKGAFFRLHFLSLADGLVLGEPQPAFLTVCLRSYHRPLTLLSAFLSLGFSSAWELGVLCKQTRKKQDSMEKEGLRCLGPLSAALRNRWWLDGEFWKSHWKMVWSVWGGTEPLSSLSWPISPVFKESNGYNSLKGLSTCWWFSFSSQKSTEKFNPSAVFPFHVWLLKTIRSLISFQFRVSLRVLENSPWLSSQDGFLDYDSPYRDSEVAAKEPGTVLSWVRKDWWPVEPARVS